MDHLGHIIDANGIHADTKQMQKLHEGKMSQNFDDVQRFHGLVQYLRAQLMPNVLAHYPG
jgi:hypothetical protein